MKVLTVVRQALGISWTDVHGLRVGRCVRIWTWGRFELAGGPIRRCSCRSGRLVYAAQGPDEFVTSAVRVVGGAVLAALLVGAAVRMAMHMVLADVRVERSGGVR